MDVHKYRNRHVLGMAKEWSSMAANRLILSLLFCAVTVFGAAPSLYIPWTAPRGTNGITVTTNPASGIFIIGGGGGSQTPWTSDIDAATFALTNLGQITIGTNEAPLTAGVYSERWSIAAPGGLNVFREHVSSTNNSAGIGFYVDMVLDGDSTNGFTGPYSYGGLFFNGLPAKPGSAIFDGTSARGLAGKCEYGIGGLNDGEGAGVLGEGIGVYSVQFGTLGTAWGSLAGQTNIGSAGVAILDDLASVGVGGYFGVSSNVYTANLYVPSVLLLDNFDSRFPLLTARTGSGTTKTVFTINNEASWSVRDTNDLGGFIKFTASTNSGTATLYIEGSPPSQTISTNIAGSLKSGITTNITAGLITFTIVNGVITAVTGL